MKYLFLLLSFVFTIGVSAKQKSYKGYIVTKKQDTIKCNIILKKPYCAFHHEYWGRTKIIVEIDSVRRKYDAGQLHSYHFSIHDSLLSYYSKYTNNQHRFTKLDVKDRVNLYSFWNCSYYQNLTKYYFVIEDTVKGEKYVFANGTGRKKLMILFSEFPELAEKVRTRKFNTRYNKHWIAMVKEYNNCLKSK
jgi:hypothetical protein